MRADKAEDWIRVDKAEAWIRADKAKVQTIPNAFAANQTRNKWCRI